MTLPDKVGVATWGSSVFSGVAGAGAERGMALAECMPVGGRTVELVNDNTPEISRIQIDLLVNSLANDMARVATLQYMRSVGMAQGGPAREVGSVVEGERRSEGAR